ncbi:MAG: chromosome segregation protein SMC [Eggerthellales bacterium]|nr:chromosome segregation protein SMC [Eggerthellales bacterium]
MHLKQLILKGFKSFADRSVISLEPGITAVVGPNGSGKSNISDAVLWVLGERNARNLRGQSMEDVIFAGSSARKGVGMAEVDLVLDNSDGTLPVEYDEVCLTRRMYRNGESEYLINGSLARRMDFMDILHDTGLGTGTHSIISQGNLDAILNSRPEERRTLLEEAAGVLKHKQRKERSAKKLASMDAQLSRVKDITAEVERQLKPLARKAQRAEAYEGLSQELSELELVLAVDDLRLLQSQWDQVLKSELEAAAEIDLRKLKVQSAEEDLEKLQVLLQQKGLYVGDLTEKRGRFHMAQERLDSSRRLLSEKSRAISNRLETAENSYSANQRRISQFTEETQILSERLEEMTACRDSLQKSYDEASSTHAGYLEQRNQLDASINSTTVALKTCQREYDSLVSKKGSLIDSLQGKRSSQNLLSSRLEQVALELEESKAQLAQKCAGLDEQAAEIEVLKEKGRKSADEMNLAQRTYEATRSELESLRSQFADAKAGISAIMRVQASLLKSNGASAWVQEHVTQYCGEGTPLSQLIKCPPQLEGLVESLLGPDVSGLVVSDSASATRLACALRESGSKGTATIILADPQYASTDDCASTRGVAPAEDYNFLLPQLSYPAYLQGVLEVLLGDVVLVDSLDQAMELPVSSGVRCALADGTLVWPGVKIHMAIGSSGDGGYLARQRETEQLQERMEQLQRKIQEQTNLSDQAKADLDRKRAMNSEIAQQQAQKQGSHSSDTVERDRLARRVGSLESSHKSLTEDLRRVERQLEEYQPQLDELDQRIASAQSRKDALEGDLAQMNAHRSEVSQREQDASSSLAEVRLELATTKERISSVSRQLQERTYDLQRASKSFARAQEDLSLLRVASGRVAPLAAVLEDLSHSCQIWVSDLAGKAALEQSNSESLNSAINESRSAVKQAKELLDGAVTRLGEVRVAKGRLDVQVQAAASRIVEECGISLETALETPAPEDRGAAESEAFKLRRRIANMGTIDSSAAAEYQAMKERFDYLSAQVKDMEDARGSLRRIVAAIDQRMASQFDVTFDMVNGNFQDIFGKLFEGGSAHLELVDTDGQGTLGVEVHAQPRGKRIAKMSLMSGGEKSLCALALLFAVYRIRKTPFYILDEVEAALDDSNLRRLLTYLETLRQETQLIMITHQRRTMEMSDVLYGVSMQSDGVTKVLSQKLDKSK